MLLKIEAIDTLFFRDAKPNIIGADSWSDAQFPPNPTVLYGALRTAFLAQNPIAFEQLNDAENPIDVTTALRIRGIYLVPERELTIYL